MNFLIYDKFSKPIYGITIKTNVTSLRLQELLDMYIRNNLGEEFVLDEYCGWLWYNYGINVRPFVFERLNIREVRDARVV